MEIIFSLVLMITLSIVSVALILISVFSTLKQYVTMKKEGDEFGLNTNTLFFTLFIPIVYISTLGFVVYLV